VNSSDRVNEVMPSYRREARRCLRTKAHLAKRRCLVSRTVPILCPTQHQERLRLAAIRQWRRKSTP
jgi:hypothetical protein